MFLEKNPLRQADKFINKELTGTGQMCIVFKMRDRVNLREQGGAERTWPRGSTVYRLLSQFQTLSIRT